ncbi:TonB-dependent receptor [Croceibacterium sp. TMG7-5b_MA50]|uniref:TonB-dependent receptor n=1 Tax=Croceibacterium sp. TMG7-5b_MA50 TaxID=3121290 RepID=UPI003221DFCF
MLAIIAASGVVAPAAAQTQTPQLEPGRAADEQVDPANPPGSGEIVVTGFRASLDSALELKRNETAAIDSIVAEDIGKFPDSNLAESMQRIPGVALARGDGGEGRNISVRGLGAQFTRVRLNGMEGTSQTGGSDIFGAGNTGRSFDFNTFPTEIFSRLTVRKTPSADVEEGSLGATVDLTAPKPFDNDEDFVLSMTARGVYNEVSKQVDPRASLLTSFKFNDDWGVLFSAAYQRRNLREVGYAAVDLLPADINGGFCSPIGFTPQNPANNAAKGVTPTMCSTDNPRTGTVAAYQTIRNLTRPDANGNPIPGGGAFFPRIPRYVNSEQDQQRIAGTLTLQYQPSADTDISVDLLLSEFEVERRDNYIAGLSFARSISNNGQPMVSVRDIEFDQNGSLVYGLFDGVDVRSEGLVDRFTTTYQQANLNVRQRLGDTLEFTGLVGISESRLDGPSRLQTFIDAIDVDSFSIDYRDGNATPVINYGFDVSNPANFNYAPGRADGTVLGGFSLQGRPLRNTIDNFTGEGNLAWEASDTVTFKVGGQYRESEFRGRFYAPYTADIQVRPLPAGVTLADITTQIEGVGDLWGNGAPDSWVAIDSDAFRDVFNYDDIRLCDASCGGGDTRIRERIASGYAMATFDATDLVGIGVRGDIGVRYVHTDQRSSGYVTISAPGQTPTNVRGDLRVAEQSYDDWLPSANLVIEPVDSLLLRLSAAKVMSRPELQQLTPTSGVNPITRSGNVQNPFLEPIRANTFDAAVEWYWAPGALLSVAFFYKDLQSFVQTINSLVPFTDLNLPEELLIGSNTGPNELFNVSRPTNTDGGPLKGVEVNAQIPFSAFADGFFSNVGVLANYTHVTSEIEYCLQSSAGNCIRSTTNDLVGLSRNTASGTLYYDDGKFSIRSTANWRDRFLRGIPASTGSDIQGNAPTLFVDASASYAINDNVGLILEAQNLTDEQNRFYIDSVREDTLFQTRFGRTFTAGVNVQF